MVVEQLQVARGLVIEPRLFREKIWGVGPQWSANEHHPARGQFRRLRVGSEAEWEHGVEQRQADGDASGAEHRAAREQAGIQWDHEWCFLTW